MEKLRIKILQGIEIQREPIEETKRLKALNEYTDDPLRVLGVPFSGHKNGKDADGEYFHPETSIGLDIGDSRPITYYHGFGPDDPRDIQDTPAIIGRAVYTGMDKRGHWFDAYIDNAEPLGQRILAGDEVKASSGAISHLVRMGEDGRIDNWLVGELALFDTNEWRRPANELAIVEKKSAISDETIEPQEAAKAGEAIPVQELEVESVSEIENKKESTMDEQEKQEEVKALTKEDIEGIIEKAVKASMPAYEKGAPATIKARGEKSETAGWLDFIRTGKENGSYKGSNDTDMNIGTAADGGNLVPTGFYNQIITRVDEMALDSLLGVTQIPGIGTTVEVPYDDEGDGEFIVATETQEIDDDAPAVGKKSLTLKKYGKIIRISHELLRDEDVRLEAFLMNWVARGMAKTKNDLLITEVETYGTSLKTFASATAVAVGELEAMVFNSDMVSYLEGGSPAWVMSGPSYAKISSLTGSDRVYVATPQGTGLPGPGIMGYPVRFSNKADTISASKKSVFFGDWSSVGVRNGSGIQMIRDPYTRARYGQIELVFLFDCVYGVLNAEAIGYGVHPSA